VELGMWNVQLVALWAIINYAINNYVSQLLSTFCVWKWVYWQRLFNITSLALVFAPASRQQTLSQ
jgi:hypothetical protein